jgi:hypothetical protein
MGAAPAAPAQWVGNRYFQGSLSCFELELSVHAVVGDQYLGGWMPGPTGPNRLEFALQILLHVLELEP